MKEEINFLQLLTKKLNVKSSVLILDQGWLCGMDSFPKILTGKQCAISPLTFPFLRKSSNDQSWFFHLNDHLSCEILLKIHCFSFPNLLSQTVQRHGLHNVKPILICDTKVYYRAQMSMRSDFFTLVPVAKEYTSSRNWRLKSHGLLLCIMYNEITSLNSKCNILWHEQIAYLFFHMLREFL